MAETSRVVNPEMVRLARESRGLGLKELAERVGVVPSSISRVESGLRDCSQAMLAKLADALGYPASFFCQSDKVYGFGVSGLFHRKFQDVPAKALHAIHAEINIRRINLERLLRGVDIMSSAIGFMDLSEFDGSVEDVARTVRARWRLPHGPVSSLVAAIEEAGGIVIPFDFGTRRLDAISEWLPGMPPLFFVNSAIPGDRQRFTLAHELAHITMHQQSPTPTLELEANRFAAEFLMPERDVRPYLDDLTLPKLAALKPHWKVSMSALLKRAGDLGAITESRAHSLWSTLSKRGYRTKEPAELDIPQESGTLYQEIIDVHRRDLGYSVEELAALLNLTEEDTRRYYVDGLRRMRLVAQ